MNVIELRDKTSKLKISKQKFINETFLWVNLARESVKGLSDEKLEFYVPKAKSPNELKPITRNKPSEVKERILSKDIYNSAFVSLVASVEDYLYKISEWILLYDNNRIKCTIKDVNSENSISVIDLIDNEKEDLISKIITQKLAGLFYASPKKQIEYYEKALDIVIDSTIWQQWIEIKARRDLLVHNNGLINDIYLTKTENTDLSLKGTEIIISDDYFTETIGFLKRMTGQIDKRIRNCYK